MSRVCFKFSAALTGRTSLVLSMAPHKRALEDNFSTHKQKRSKISSEADNHLSPVITEEVDFPRGGGTSFTPLEVKAIRAEAVREANEELFGVCVLLLFFFPSDKCHRLSLESPRRENADQRYGRPE